MESAGERTEKATAKKRRDAREKGQVRKSQEVVTSFSMLTMFGALALFGTGMWTRMQGLLTTVLSGQLYTPEHLAAGDVASILLSVILEFALTILPVLAVAIVSGVAFNLVQVGFLFSTEALKPSFGKLNPLKGLKRMFSLRTLFELAKSIAKVIVIGIIAYNKYISFMDRYAVTTALSIPDAIRLIASMVLEVAFTIAGALVFIAAVDFVYQWFKYEKDLRMTKQEVKMEYKQQEGDPQIKGKIKQKQRQMAMMRMMQDVPDADVVITNPTHYAVALKYDEAVSAAPLIIAKGADFLAQRIKEVALEHHVEVVENVDVARGLYSLCEVGSEVPFELYQAVAEILAYVYRKKNKR